MRLSGTLQEADELLRDLYESEWRRRTEQLGEQSLSSRGLIDDFLPDVSEAAQQERLRYWKSVLGKLNSIAFERLSAAAKQDYSIYEQQISTLIAQQQYRMYERPVNDKRQNPADDLLSGLVHDAEPPLTNAQLVDVALVLLGAGHETTANMLGLGTLALLDDPDQLAALRADPSLIDNTVEELLRYLSIVQLGVTRIATEDVTVGGVDIPAGTTVVIATPEANRDQRHFPEPDRLDVHRPRTPHLAFGHGIHQCLGQQLARIEMRIGFAELFNRLPNLRLAVPVEEIPLRNDMQIFGVHALPVTWA
jgi:cytochrome P450